MNDSNEIDEIIDRIKTGKYTETDVDILYRLSRSGDRETISQLGKYNVNIKDGKDIHIGDHIYQQWDRESIEALVKAIQENSGINQNTQGGDAAAGNIDKSINFIQIICPSDSFKKSSKDFLEGFDFSGVPQENIKEAYQGLLNSDINLWNWSENEIIQKLKAHKNPGHLAEFFSRLVEDENLPLEVRNRFKECAKQLPLKKLQEDPKNKSSPSRGSDRAEQLKSYLIATLTPDDNNKDLFLFNAWLIVDDSIQDLSKFDSLLDPEDRERGKLVRKSQIPIELNKFIRKSLKILRGTRYLIIEIFLPIHLMCMDIDRWKISDSVSNEIPLGTKYPVRIRSLERLDFGYLYDYLFDWRTCWDNGRIVLDSGTIHDVFEHLEEIENFSWKSLKIKLKEKIGLKITCIHPKSIREDLFRAILQATTPVTIWIRNDIPNLDVVTAIDEVLAFKPLSNLCESVRQTREEADAQKDEHLGLHLAVIWENPRRLTPDAMAEFYTPGQ
jgi:hypothetical protein